MKILVINCGSSSIKYKLYEKEKVIASGYIQRIGVKGSDVKDHTEGIKLMFNQIIESKAVLKLEEINAVGHRVVHGGELSKSSIVDEKVLKTIEKFCPAAPLHNPAELKGILAVKKQLPKVKNVAVFDTAFHQTMPKKAYVYALPYKYFEHGIRRYGFHGISHNYVALKAAEMLGKPIEKLKLITCHLGAGCSITAIDKGKSVDTSMGFTPMEGLVMGTRCGDIDAGILIYLMKENKLEAKELDEMLNNQSGLFGISGHSDFRDVVEGFKKGEEKAKLAFEIFVHGIKKYIGDYLAVLDGADAIVFTGGIGENNPLVRKHAAEMNYLDIKIDDKKNEETMSYFASKDSKFKKEGIVSAVDSKIKVLVIPTDEEMMIARETEKIIG